MSRSDLLRQRHRALQPRVTADATTSTDSTTDTTRTDVPDPSAQNFAMRVRETLMTYLGRQGDPMDRGITLRDLLDAGVVTLNPGYSLGSGAGSLPIGGGGGTSSSIKPDLTPPPQIQHLVVTPSLTNIFFETEDPTWSMGHGYFVTNIYGAEQLTSGPPPTFDKAIPIYSFTGTVGSWATTPDTTWFIWAKWETRDGVESISPAGGINGVSVTTGKDVDKLVSAMTGPGEPFKIVPVQMTLPDGSVVPAGTYTADAYIHNGFITNAQIANLAVDNAKIGNVSAAKLTAGVVTAATMNSPTYNGTNQGWYLDVNGNANFGQIRCRGYIYATDGVFSGTVYAYGGSFAGDISAATGRFKGGVMGGAFQGYGWPASGTGYFLGPINTSDPNSGGGLLMGNGNLGQYFQVEYNGNVYAPNFSIINGAVTVNGTLSMDNGSATKLVISPSQILVYQNGVLRVRMGVW